MENRFHGNGKENGWKFNACDIKRTSNTNHLVKIKRIKKNGRY
jgi:hypothetical protein